MSLSIGSVNSYSSADIAQRIFKKADTNSDGGIDKDEFSAMASSAPGGAQSKDAIDKKFAELDVNGDGKIDQSENETALKKKDAKSAPPAGGPPPSGGAQKAAGGSGSSSASSAKVYDKKDANKDGTVSYQEEMVYDQKHPGEVDESASAGSKNKLQSEAGYDRQGSVSAAASQTQSALDISA